jgi:hypothetical protein
MHKNITLKLSLLFLTVFPFATLALCQGSQPSAAMISEGVSGCSLSYFSGPLTTFTRYCLSANGNILQLDSPSGFEFINNGGLMEGYGICDDTSNVSYYDYASQNSGNWGGSVATAVNATTEKFVRTSSDGIWQLTQTIQQIKASASGTGGVKITMALKNLTGIARNVTLLRVANVNAGPVPTTNEFVSSDNSAFGQEPGASWGLGLTTNTFTFAHNGAVFNVPTGPDPCHYVTHIVNFAFVEDGSIGHVYAISVPKGATKTVAMTYKPM